MARRAVASSLPTSPTRPATRRNPATSPIPAPRRGPKAAPQAAPSASAPPSKARGAKPARASKPNTDGAQEALPTTEEDGQRPLDGIEQAAQEALNNSALSGTTAASIPDSATEVQGLQANSAALVKSLPDLNDDSSRVLRLLAPRNSTPDSVSELLAELQKPRSDVNKQLRRYEPQFKETFDQYKVSTAYILPDLVLRALFHTEEISRSAQWRPDDILHKANLAKVLVDVMSPQGKPEDNHELLRYLDHGFSRLFFTSLVESQTLPAQSTLVNLTFDTALSIRTQLAISSLLVNKDKHQGINRLSLIYSTLLSDPNGVTDPDVDEPKGWNIPIFESDDVSLKPEYREKIVQRCSTLCEAVSSNQSVDFDKLESSFPWLSFQIQIAMWAAARTKETDTQIAKQGGADEIAMAFEEELKTRAAGKNSSSKLTDLPFTIGKFLKRKSDNLFGISVAPRPTRQQQDEIAPPSGGVVVFEVERPGSARAPKTRGGPRKRLLDRQDGAEKVSFGDTQPTQPDAPPAVPPIAPMSQHPSEMESATQDEGFQQAQGTPSGKKRGRPPGVQAAPRRKRIRVVEDPDADFEAGDANDGANNDENQSPAPARTIPPASNYASVNESARQITSLQGKTKPAQKRRPWTTDECNALIYCIQMYGVSWTMIKQKDKELHGWILAERDQVALKDKARNMKFDYLKAGVTLPRNFDNIPLDRKLKDKLSPYVDPE